MDDAMMKYCGLDPSRISERPFNGPVFMSGWMLKDGSRIFNEDKTRMWFTSIINRCLYEGLNYDGHKI